MTHYILENDEIKEVTLMEWAAWFETADRVIAKHELDEIAVSTAFLGVDHNFSMSGPPLLFETMIFGGEHDDYQDRCSTKAEAIVMHAKALQLAFPQHLLPAPEAQKDVEISNEND